MTGILMLCTAGLGSASAAPTTSSADASPDARTEAAGPRTGSLYVSDYTANDILKLRLPGGSQSTVPTTGLTRPTYLALDRAKRLYISDTLNNRIVRVSADGEQTTVPTSGLSRPLGLALSRSGDLYVADSFNDRVVKIPAGGGEQTTVPTSGLLHPAGLALDEDEDQLYVADFVNDRVVKVPTGGGGQTTVPTSGLSQPTGLALSPRANRLYISDSGNDRVVRVPTGGGGQTTVPTTGLSSPQGLTLDRRRNLYVADFGNDRVVRVPGGGGRQTTVPFTGLTTPVGLVTQQAVRTRLEARPATAERRFHPPVLEVRGLSAKLTRAGGEPLADKTVRFGNASRSKQLCRAATDKRGVAHCDVTIRGDQSQVDRLYRDLRSNGYRASFPGTAAYEPSTDTGHVRTGH